MLVPIQTFNIYLQVSSKEKAWSVMLKTNPRLRQSTDNNGYKDRLTE